MELEIVIECRGLKEDRQLYNHFQQLLINGTDKLTSAQINQVSPNFTFRNKLKNINGLQLADLVAYPIARYIIAPDNTNPAYKILEPKIFRKNDLQYGLIIFP